jgi:hypothetical protein
VAVEVAVPEQFTSPAAQSTEAFVVETAEGPEVAAVWPGRVTSGPEEAWESVAAWHPPALTWQAPLPDEVFACPFSRAASAPVAVLSTLPEQLAEPAAQFSDPEASETLSNPPVIVGAAVPVPVDADPVELVPAALVVFVMVGARVSGVNRVADSEVVWQAVLVAVQSDDPVEVFAAAGVAVPVLGSTVTSPAPVEEVFEVPLPEQPVVSFWQVIVTAAPLELVGALASAAVSNRPVSSVVVGWAVEPEAAWQPPVVIVQEDCPVVARVTGVVAGVVAGTGVGVVAGAAVVGVGVGGAAGAAAGMVSVWELWAPVLLVALPEHPVAPAAHCASASACGPPSPAPFNVWSTPPSTPLAPPTPPPLPVRWLPRRLLAMMPVGSLTE